MSGTGSGRDAPGESACRQWIAAASRVGAGLRSTVRFQYQNTKAAIDRKTAISNSTTGTSRPPGKTCCLASSPLSVLRDTTNRLFATGAGMCAAAANATGSATLGTLAAALGALSSEKDPAGTFAAVRIPLNLPAQPRQYRARSLLAVWHDSQNFVMAIPRGRQLSGSVWMR
ncbi:hypothetical protein QTI24_25450 [Variovorax sp. J22P240]|uniref:hypothetical protein n=1 Tax=unclassified Variovorax TaxID=663243 RepID=UPI002577ACDE|nr:MULTISPECIES: hypothetical protein [unclassified Variovorax]MDM0001976.1 hypothetical protein [Variovorax sp. J22P240]MDM0047619.1 hypothetical protein [Variovorax sp. J22R115]